MIADLNPYPAMKESGIEWLGKVPKHWEVERGKWLFRKMERPVQDSDEHITCFRDGTVTLRKNRRVRGFTESLKEIGYQGIRRGDLVIHNMDAFAGAIGVSDSDGKGTPVYSVCKPEPNVNAKFYASALREMARSQWIQALAKGIRERSTDFRFESFSSQRVPFPPLPEQTAIVRFLDDAERRIRCYICAKQKLIELQEEQKQAIIHQAVTGQIDVRTGRPYPAYKPSGVEWLGEVPRHWEIRPFTRSALEVADYRGATPRKTDSGVFLATAKNIKIGWIDYNASTEFVAEDEYAEIMRRGLPQCGDLLLTTEAPLGHAALVDREDIALAQRVIRFRFASKILLSEFALRSVLVPYFQHQLLCRGTGSTALGIKASKLPQLRIVCPPVDEQQAIVAHVAHCSSSIDLHRTLASREIALLQEYRTCLIADVVTGKLDVREAAARLPDVDPLAEEHIGDPVHAEVGSNLEEDEAAQEVNL